MASGTELPRGFKERAVRAADNDEWAREGDEERQSVMTEFKAALEAYKPGTPTEVAEKGLFEKLYEVMG